MYEGATPCRAFHVISGISKSILYFEGMRGLVGCGIYGSLQSRFVEYKLTQQTDHTRRSLTNQRSLNSNINKKSLAQSNQTVLIKFCVQTSWYARDHPFTNMNDLI